MADHLRLYFNLVELLARVDTNHTANHLRHDNHISQMRLDEVGLLIWLGLLLGLAKLLDQTHGLALQAAVEPTPGAGMYDVPELISREVEKSVEYRVSFGSPFDSFQDYCICYRVGRGRAYWSRSTPR